MSPRETFVIVGAGLAGARAAEQLRADGFDGRVVLVGEEPHRPYDRPPLTKEYLRGEKAADDTAVHPAAFYDENEIELRTATAVTALTLGDGAVTLATGERLAYDQLVLATGAAPRRLQIPGADLAGVQYLRTRDDADALRTRLSPGARVVVLGGGWIGAEVAAVARQRGAEVALVEPSPTLVFRALGAEIGGIFTELHADHGVELHLERSIDELVGADGALRAARLSDGTLLDADLVVAGIGALPRTEIASAAGLAIDNGIVVDERLETSTPGVFAIGDVANAYHPAYGTHLRLEHWASALSQGPTAARNMLGAAVPYLEVPFFYSDQYDFSMEYRGFAPRVDEVVFRGDVSGRAFIAFFLHNGRVAAAMNANIFDVGEELEGLLNSRAVVDPAKLRDPDIDLTSLAPPL